MRKSHEKILQALEKKPLTPLELALTTNYAVTGISTRIAELRKKGYDIETIPVESFKYFIVSKPELKEDHQVEEKIIIEKPKLILDETALKIEKWLEEKRKFNLKIELDTISKELNVPIDKVKLSISKLFKKYYVLQLSNTSVIVKK